MADTKKPDWKTLREGTHLCLACANCGWLTTKDSPDVAAQGVVTVVCSKCGYPMTCDTSKAPQGLSPEAEACSQDGSVVAFWTVVPPGEQRRVTAPIPLRKTASAATATTNDKIQQLHDIQEREAKDLEKYKDNPAMLASVRRIYDRERRKILGTAAE